MIKELRIGFAGTPEIAKIILATILKHNYKVVLVLTKVDRSSGRGLKINHNPVKILAEQYQIPILQPVTIKNNPELIAKIAEYKLDLLCVIAYGLIFSDELLKLPTYGCTNIHLSLLPRWRGAAPIARAILAGDVKTGVSIMQMDHGLDSGALYLTRELHIDPLDNTFTLYHKLIQSSIDLILEYLLNIHKLKAKAQIAGEISYALKITKTESLIDWSNEAFVIARNVRGFNPYPGAYTIVAQQNLKIWQAAILDYKIDDLKLGELNFTQQKIVIKCGNNSFLAIEELQLANCKRIKAKEFITGYPQFNKILLG